MAAVEPGDGCVDSPISRMRKPRLPPVLTCSDFQTRLPPVAICLRGPALGSRAQSLGTGDRARSRGAPARAGALSPNPAESRGAPTGSGGRPAGQAQPGAERGAARGAGGPGTKVREGLPRGPQPSHCPVGRGGGGGDCPALCPPPPPPPPPLGLPVREAANGRLGGAAPLGHRPGHPAPEQAPGLPWRVP